VLEITSAAYPHLRDMHVYVCAHVTTQGVCNEIMLHSLSNRELNRNEVLV
jgi:hypothetical protein